MTHATYLPGRALAIVTPRVALLTAAEGFDAIDGFWRLAIAGETHMPTILDALAGDGFAAMPGFALRVSSDTAVSLVLRHGYVAWVDEPGGARTLDAACVETWVEHRIEPAVGVRLAVAGNMPADDVRAMPIECGVVRASAIMLGKVTMSGAAPSTQSPAPATDMGPQASDSGSVPLPGPTPSAPPPAKPAPDPAIAEAPTEREPDVRIRDEPSSAGKPDASARDEPVPSAVTASDEPTTVSEPVAAAEPVAASKPFDSAATLVEPEDSRFDAMFGATIAGRRPEDAAVRSDDDVSAAVPDAVASTTAAAPSRSPAAPTTSAAAPVARLGDHDDLTVTHSQLRDARARVSTDAEPQPALAAPAIRLALSTGREVVVDRPLLVGRAPQARNASGSTLPTLVTVDDEYVSSTHLEIRPAGDSLVVTDVSSNGTVLRRADAPAVPMRRGEPTEVFDGAVLQISDDISISVIVS